MNERKKITLTLGKKLAIVLIMSGLKVLLVFRFYIVDDQSSY